MSEGNRKKRRAKRVRFKQPPDLPNDDFLEDNDDEEACRCICGDNDFTAKRPWTQCTDCEAWQHNDCMDTRLGISVYDDELEDHYWCHTCAPERHVKLLAEAGRGGKPWESRVEQRVEAKHKLEDVVRAMLERSEMLWELYEPQPRAVAGNDLAVPLKRIAPKSYIEAAQAGLKALLEDLPMQSLRDLSQKLESHDTKHEAMKLLRRAARKEYNHDDFHVLGLLSDLFELAEKGTFYNGESSGNS